MKGLALALNFPNPSRSYDQRRRSVRFWGHDGAFEVSFTIEQAAFARLDSTATQDEFGSLKAFDRHRIRIQEVAGRLYARRRVDSCTLVASDF